MTAPTSPEFTPAWLAPADVRDWLSANGSGGAADDARLTRCAAAVEPQVEAARPDCWSPVVLDPRIMDSPTPVRTYVPTAEVYQAAVQLAGRLVRRRNSPGGLESFADSVMYVSRWDPDIQRALRQGPWRPAQVG